MLLSHAAESIPVLCPFPSDRTNAWSAHFTTTRPDGVVVQLMEERELQSESSKPIQHQSELSGCMESLSVL